MAVWNRRAEANFFVFLRDVEQVVRHLPPPEPHGRLKSPLPRGAPGAGESAEADELLNQGEWVLSVDHRKVERATFVESGGVDWDVETVF